MNLIMILRIVYGLSGQKKKTRKQWQLHEGEKKKRLFDGVSSSLLSTCFFFNYILFSYCDIVLTTFTGGDQPFGWQA
jgi:hypothetical protein